MELLDQNTSVPQQRSSGFRELFICQILGIAALALIFYTITGGEYPLLRYTMLIVAGSIVVVKPGLIPYAFIASLFTIYGIITSGFMFAIIIADIVFVAFVLPFVFYKNFDFQYVFAEQRRLFVILVLFLLWATVGFVINFYSHEQIANIASAFHIFNIFQLIVIVAILCQPLWKQYREKIILCFLICALFDIMGSMTIRIMSDKFSTMGFQRLTSTLGTPHHGSMGNTLMLTFGVACCAYFIFKKDWQKIFAGVMGIICLAVLIISGSRSNVMGLVFALPITVLLGFRLKTNTLFITIAAMGIALIIFWLSPLRTVAMIIMSGDMDVSAYGRLLIWERVYEHALHGPWLQKIVGIGIGTFNTLRFNVFLEAGTWAPSGHNNFFTAFVEIGIVGFIIYLAIHIEMVRRLTARGRNGDNSARCYLMITLALLFSCLTQETFWFSTAFGRFWLAHILLYLAMFNNFTNTCPTLSQNSTS